MFDNTALGKRIAVIGCSGAGKSTLSMQLGEVLRLPVYHLDKLHWRPGWVEPPKDEWIEINRSIAQDDEWIIDGNYGGTLELRLSRATAVIMLDFPRWLCLARVVKRWLRHRGKVRPDMSDGCPEKIDFEFLQYIWRFNAQNRPQTLEKIAAFPALKTLFLRKPSDVRRFLNAVTE